MFITIITITHKPWRNSSKPPGFSGWGTSWAVEGILRKSLQIPHHTMQWRNRARWLGGIAVAVKTSLSCHLCTVWTESGTSGRPTNSGVLWQKPVQLHGTGLWAKAYDRFTWGILWEMLQTNSYLFCREFLGTAGCRRGVGSLVEGLHAFWRWWAGKMMISSSKSVAMVLSQKRVECPFQDGRTCFPNYSSLSILRVCSTVRGEWTERFGWHQQ